MASRSSYDITKNYYKFLETEDLISHRESIEEIIARYRDSRGGLIPVLQQVQNVIKFLPPTVQDYIAIGLGVPASNVFGVVTFYSFFTMEPRGDFIIKVCLGTACYVKGASRIVEHIERGFNVKVGETTEDKLFTLQEVRCLGACGLAPVVMVNEDTYGMVKPDKIVKLLNDNYSGTSG